MDLKRLCRTLEATSVAVFFLHALRVIFSVVFGIIYDQIFEGPLTAWLPISVILVVLALIAPVLEPRQDRRGWLATFAALVALTRVALTINDAQVRYWAALIVLATGGLYLAVLLAKEKGIAFRALIAALAVEQVLQIAGHSYDVSLREGWLPMQIVWGIGVVGVALWLYRNTERDERSPEGLGLLGGLAVGGWLFVETSLLELPHAIARWSRWPYEFIAPALLVVTLLPLLPPIRLWLIRQLRPGRLVLGLALPLGLMIGYFGSGIVAALALILAQTAAVGALALLLSSESAERPKVGLALALGLAIFLILNFANAFAFTYPYTLPVMRGMGWTVYLAASLAVLAGLIALRRATRASTEQEVRLLPLALGGLVGLAIALVAVWPQPVTPFANTGRVRVGTYNIHYGYDDDWHLTLEAIAQTIEQSGADIVALQEVDTGRMTSYSTDNAYYLARRLRMHVLYLPCVEHLTGIALLYRSPATASDMRLITSLQEQTGIVMARVEVMENEPLSTLYAYGIWMGLSDEDTLTQIQEALAFIGDRSPAVFGGDFNAQPDSAVAQAIREAGFLDPFDELGIDPAPMTSPAITPRSRIDFVWTRGVMPYQAEVLDSLASDHRMVLIEVVVVP